MIYITNYDEIWKNFITICQTDDINLPSSDIAKYECIKSAVKHFNNKVGDIITCDDITETVSEILNGNKLILISHYMRYTFLNNQLILFATTYSPFLKEIGQRNMQSQMSFLNKLVENENIEIDRIISNILEYM